MRDILTVTLNPALDIATSVDHVVPGVKLRCSQPQTDPGGGGINVARAIQLLGGRAKAFVALGGDTGQSLRNLLESFEMDLAVYEAPGETRQSIAVTDLGLKDQFRFMLPGPHWKLDDIEKVTEAIRAAAPNNGYVILSGSGPSGSRADLYSRICAALADTGAKVIVDTSGPALTLLALGQMSPPYVLRMDQAEADKNIAQAKAEERRAMAVAAEQEFTARAQEMRALLSRSSSTPPGPEPTASVTWLEPPRNASMPTSGRAKTWRK